MKINWQTVVLTGLAMVTGAVLVGLKHEQVGGMLITFAVGGAFMKSAVQR